MQFFDKFDLFNDKSDEDGFVSGSPGTCDFPFFSGKSVGVISGIGSHILVSTRIKSIGDVVSLV